MRVQNYLGTLSNKGEPKLNLHRYIPKEFAKKEQTKYLKFTGIKETPARKQVETSIANKYTYKEGDEEYNFWYSKYICAKDEK